MLLDSLFLKYLKNDEEMQAFLNYSASNFRIGLPNVAITISIQTGEIYDIFAII